MGHLSLSLNFSWLIFLFVVHPPPPMCDFEIPLGFIIFLSFFVQDSFIISKHCCGFWCLGVFYHGFSWDECGVSSYCCYISKKFVFCNCTCRMWHFLVAYDTCSCIRQVTKDFFFSNVMRNVMFFFAFIINDILGKFSLCLVNILSTKYIVV